ncbi:hypothetical protein JCM5353_007304 [Sporobolomyces roseus]
MEWERLDLIMGPPRSVSVAQRRPLSTSTLSSSASLPSSLQPVSSKESYQSTSSPSIVPKFALSPPSSSRAAAGPHSTSSSSSLPHRPRAAAAHDVPFPRTSSGTRPRPVLPSKPVSDLPSPANLDTSTTLQRQTITRKRFFGTDSPSEQPQKRRRLASNDDELGSTEKGKGKGKGRERDVSKEVEEGELTVPGKAKESNGEQITRSTVGLIDNSASTPVSTQAASTHSAHRSISHQIDLPQPGDIFPSEESLYCHTGVALTLTWGFSAIRRLNAASVQYDCTIKGCPFKIKADAVTQTDGKGLTTRWHVKSSSVYNHTHDRREALTLDPNWRPTIRKEEIVKGWQQIDENGRLDDEDQVERASTSEKKVSRFVPDPSAVLLGAPTPSVKRSTPALERSKYKSAHISSGSSDEGSVYSASSASPEPAPSHQPSAKPKARERIDRRARAPSPEFSAPSESKPVRTISPPTRPTPPPPKPAPPTSGSTNIAPIPQEGSSTPVPDQAFASTSAARPTVPSNPSHPCLQPTPSTSAPPAPSSSMPPPRLPASSSFFAARRLPPQLAATTSRLVSPLSKDTAPSIPPELLSFISSLSPSSTSPDKVKLIASILFRAGFDTFEAITELVAFERATRGKVWEIFKLELGEDEESCEIIEGIERRIVEAGEEGWKN